MQRTLPFRYYAGILGPEYSGFSYASLHSPIAFGTGRITLLLLDDIGFKEENWDDCRIFMKNLTSYKP